MSEAKIIDGKAFAAGLRGRIGVEHGRLVHLALDEAHALAVFQIDGGKEDHGRQPRKLVIRRRPTAWLFSGWN